MDKKELNGYLFESLGGLKDKNGRVEGKPSQSKTLIYQPLLYFISFLG